MRVLCVCGAYMLNPEHATYVRDGKPFCHEQTCAKVKERRHGIDNEMSDGLRREIAARETC